MKRSSQRVPVFVLLYEGDVVGVFDNEDEARLVVYESRREKQSSPWRLEETIYHKVKNES